MKTETTNTIAENTLEGLTSIKSFGDTLIYLTYIDGDVMEVEEYCIDSIDTITQILDENNLSYASQFDEMNEWVITIN